MIGRKAYFDLTLAYPQWQGSGRASNLARGAEAAARVCCKFAKQRHVPFSNGGEAVGGINRWPAIFGQFCAAQDLLRAERPDRVLTAGGDCAVDIAVIDYLRGRYPDLTVIWVDAHLDANTPATSPSGDFHGMPVAAILGSAPEALQPLLAHPLPASQFYYVAAAVGDEGDWHFQSANDLRWLTPETVIAGPVHIHFDLDVLDPREFPFLAYKDGQLSKTEGVELVRQIATSADLVGLTITEFSPADEAEAAEGSGYIEDLCQAAIVSA